MFALKLPKTIAEKDDKYEAESEEASIPDPLQHQEKVSNSEVEVEKIVPLPGMPTKNETFQNLHLFKTTLSKEAQVYVPIRNVFCFCSTDVFGADLELPANTAEIGVGAATAVGIAEANQSGLSWSRGRRPYLGDILATAATVT